MKKLIIVAGLAVFFLGSCKKEDTCSLTESNIVGKYRLSALTYQESPGSQVTDIYNTELSDCERDNEFIFNADGSFYYQDAGMTCNPPYNYNSGWSLSGRNLQFGGDFNYVDQFDCNSMVITTQDWQMNGDVLTATYVKN